MPEPILVPPHKRSEERLRLIARLAAMLEEMRAEGLSPPETLVALAERIARGPRI